MKTVAAGLLAVMIAASAYAETTYVLDKTHAHVGFTVSHLVISKVKGSFGDFEAKAVLGDDGQLTSAEATVQISSIDTDNEKRDEHLRSADFFEADKFPVMTFSTTAVEYDGDAVSLKGDLTIRDVTKPVTLEAVVKGPIKDPWGNSKLGLEASTTIDRQDFGLTWSKTLETGGLVVGNEVEIEVLLEFAAE